jgi:hypothetical protein
LVSIADYVMLIASYGRHVMGGSTINRPRRRTRRAHRLVHLVAAPSILAYVYVTPSPGAPLTVAVRWVAIPVLVLSGLLMWQGPRLRRRLARQRAGR